MTEEMQQIGAINTSNSRGMNFNLGISAFEQNVVYNFKHIQMRLDEQFRQINSLKLKILDFQEGKAQLPIKTQAFTTKDEECDTVTVSRDQPNEQFHQQVSLQKLIQAGGEDKHDAQSSLLQQSTVKLIVDDKDNGSKINDQKTIKEGQIMQINSLPNNDDPNSELIYGKIFQLFQRVRQLEEKQTSTTRFNMKKFREIDFQLDSNTQLIEKNRKINDQFDSSVQKLRNQLSEFKLKKQAKLMKVLSSTSQGLNTTGNFSNNNFNNNNSQSYDYVAQKLQFLLKHIKQLLTKKSFEEQRDIIHQNVQNLRKKVNENINETFFNDAMKSFEVRIYQTVAKHIKALQMRRQVDKDLGQEKEIPKNDQLQSIIEEGNKQFNAKVGQHDERLKELKEQLTLLRSEVQLNRKERLQFQEQTLEQTKLSLEDMQVVQRKVEEIQKYLQDMKQNYDKKHLETQNQIIQIQQNLQKINSHIKSYNFATKDSTSNRSNYVQSQQNLEFHTNEKSINPQLENDLKMQQKKMNKLVVKVQGCKEDILHFRQDFNRQIQGMKMNFQKKADWESFKKALNYFDQKIKETKLIVQAIYESMGKNEQGESLAVKKGWTCLMCDKDIKNYEGKLSEVKFTSMFPVRQSPRIGGYFKQSQMSQQYKQVFLSNSNSNKNRRLGSLKSNQSREELQ